MKLKEIFNSIIEKSKKMMSLKPIFLLTFKISVFLLTIIGLISVILFIKGYRPIIDPLLYPDWIAIGVIGQWVGAIAAILIPIMVVYLSKSIKENVDNISEKAIKTIKRASSQSFIPSVEYHSSASKGIITFDYSNNNGRYCIGQNEYMFEIKFSKASDNSIYVYNDPNSISTVALVKDKTDIESINNANKYDTSSRTRCPNINQIVILQNTNGFYAGIKILDIKDDTRGAVNDEVKFEYVIQTDGTHDFSNK